MIGTVISPLWLLEAIKIHPLFLLRTLVTTAACGVSCASNMITCTAVYIARADDMSRSA